MAETRLVEARCEETSWTVQTRLVEVRHEETSWTVETRLVGIRRGMSWVMKLKETSLKYVKTENMSHLEVRLVCSHLHQALDLRTRHQTPPLLVHWGHRSPSRHCHQPILRPGHFLLSTLV